MRASVLSKATKTETSDESTKPYFIGTTRHISDHSIHHQVFTDMKFIGKYNPY
jgi:hypothetical protein